MKLTLHAQNKMAGSMGDLYLLGEDFKAILDILEDDEDLKNLLTKIKRIFHFILVLIVVT